MPIRRVTASEHGQLRFDLSGDLGCATRARSVVKGGLQPFGHKSLPRFDDCGFARESGLCNIVVRTISSLAPVAQEKNPCSGLDSRTGRTRPDEFFQLIALLVREAYVHVFAHAYSIHHGERINT